MKGKGISFLVLVIILSVVLSSVFACTPTATGPAPATIKIGGSVPITGSQASGGADLKWGYEQAVNDINATGGVYVAAYKQKIPLQVILSDDESDPTKVVSKLEALNSNDKVVCYVGSYSSALNAAAAPIAEKNKIPLVAVSFANLSPHQQGYKYLFSPFVKTTNGVDAIFQLLNSLGTSKPTKIGVWAEQTDWGKEIAAAVPEAAKKYGYQIALNQVYDPNALDFSSMITASKTAGVEVVIGVPTPTNAITMMKQMKQLDYNPAASFLWRGAGAASWPKTLAKDGDYALYLANWDTHYTTPGTAELVAAYQKAKNALPSVNIGSAYTVIQVVADAINRAGTLDPTKIRDALAGTKNLQTVEGKIQSFDATGIGILPCSIMQWQSGVAQVVYPADLASSKFIYPAKKWSER
jgi:branched-chain amino acid transport system substrate-binding protein